MNYLVIRIDVKEKIKVIKNQNDQLVIVEELNTIVTVYRDVGQYRSLGFDLSNSYH